MPAAMASNPLVNGDSALIPNSPWRAVIGPDQVKAGTVESRAGAGCAPSVHDRTDQAGHCVGPNHEEIIDHRIGNFAVTD
jgi:hypothetical protein